MFESDPSSAQPSLPVKKRWSSQFGKSGLDLLLLALTAVGAYLAITTQMQAAMWRQKRSALEKDVGILNIDDRDRFHVQFLPSDNPREFRWRIYTPQSDDCRLVTIHRDSDGGSGKSATGGSTEAGEGLVMVHLGFNQSGLVVNSRERLGGNRSSGTSIFSVGFIKSLVEANDYSAWKIAGRNGVERFGKDQMIWLLRVEGVVDEVSGKPQQIFAIALGSSSAIEESQAKNGL